MHANKDFWLGTFLALVEFGSFILGYAIKGLIARWVQDHMLVPIGHYIEHKINPHYKQPFVHHFRHKGKLRNCGHPLCRAL